VISGGSTELAEVLTPKGPPARPGFTFDFVVVDEAIDLAELFRAWEEANKPIEAERLKQRHASHLRQLDLPSVEAGESAAGEMGTRTVCRPVETDWKLRSTAIRRKRLKMRTPWH
jgi:hypothetical protein